MKKVREFLIFLVGMVCGTVYLTIVIANEPQKTFRSEEKATIDYELKANGKVVDTIWIYKIK